MVHFLATTATVAGNSSTYAWLSCFSKNCISFELICPPADHLVKSTLLSNQGNLLIKEVNFMALQLLFELDFDPCQWKQPTNQITIRHSIYICIKIKPQDENRWKTWWRNTTLTEMLMMVSACNKNIIKTNSVHVEKSQLYMDNTWTDKPEWVREHWSVLTGFIEECVLVRERLTDGHATENI